MLAFNVLAQPIKQPPRALHTNAYPAFAAFKGNHGNIFGSSVGLEVRKYRYFNPKTKGLDYQGLLEDLAAAPYGAVVVLHACAHNPTGVDPSMEQWRGILTVVQERRLLPFFDSAYQVRCRGLGAGHNGGKRYYRVQQTNHCLQWKLSSNSPWYGTSTAVACAEQAQPATLLMQPPY